MPRYVNNLEFEGKLRSNCLYKTRSPLNINMREVEDHCLYELTEIDCSLSQETYCLYAGSTYIGPNNVIKN